jgi:hypothetical protein
MNKDYTDASTAVKAAENLSCTTIAKLHAFLKQRKPDTTFNQALHVASDYFYTALDARIRNDKIFHIAFPAELESIGITDEELYNKIVNMYVDAFFLGYIAGTHDLDALLNQCETE